MVPISFPMIGGLTVELRSLFVLPVSYSLMKEVEWTTGRRQGLFVN